MSELKPVGSNSRLSTGLSESTASESLSISRNLELLCLLDKFKDESRSTLSSFDNVFVELKLRLSALQISVIDKEIDHLLVLYSLIFNDKELPEPIKVQLARLQVYILMSAVQEGGFLDYSSNPARLLLDKVFKTEVGLAISGNGERSGEDVLREGINEIISSEVVNFDSFEVLLDLYTNHINERSGPVEENKPAVKAAEVTKTTQIVLAMMREITVPLQALNKPSILFDKVWSPLLLQIALTDGLKSSAWIKTVQMAKTQVWSLVPKTTEKDQQKLLATLPHVSKSLVRGMHSLKLSAHLQNSLDEYLKLEQKEVIQQGENNIELARAGREEKPVEKTTPVETPAIASPASSKEKMIDEIDDFSSMMKTGIYQLTDEMREALNPDVNEEIIEKPVESVADKIKLGDWIEVKQDNSSELAKLTWRSEDNSLFIFVDRSGNRVREIDGTMLNYEIETGTITLVGSTAISAEKSQLSTRNVFHS
ncbi:MAG: DUF1631 family protein [Gammaproteobacteria bacterium]|nr:DUF1631 family protein [Gammaproteobacteria bacterium]